MPEAIAVGIVAVTPPIVERLKRRSDFKAASAGRKFVTRSMVLLCMHRPLDEAPPACRLGFTVTRKLGGAVVRNRIRRRLREASRVAFPSHARPGHDYVMIARPPALDRPFPELIGEMRFALSHLHKERVAS